MNKSLYKLWVKYLFLSFYIDAGVCSSILNTVCVSPDGSLAASGGKDNTAMLWDLNEGKRLYSDRKSVV